MIAFVTATQGRTGSGTSLSVSVATGSNTNPLLFVAAEIQNGDTLSTFTWNGGTTGVTQHSKVTLSYPFGVYWYAITGVSGTHNLDMAWSGTTGANIVCELLSDVDQTTPIEASNAVNISSGSNPSVSVTTLTDNAWVIGNLRFDSLAVTAASGTTERAKNAGDTGFVLFDKNAVQSPAGSYSIDTTSGAQKYYFKAFSIKPAGAAAPTYIPKIIMS